VIWLSVVVLLNIAIVLPQWKADQRVSAFVIVGQRRLDCIIQRPNNCPSWTRQSVVTASAMSHLLEIGGEDGECSKGHLLLDDHFITIAAATTATSPSSSSPVSDVALSNIVASSSSSSSSSLCLLSDVNPSTIPEVIVIDNNQLLVPVLTSPGFIAAIAVMLLVAAQSFINQMLAGDQGLAAFLKDGSGYKKSGFKVKKKNNNNNSQNIERSSDPIPWLKLPRLDFVEVAGQQTVPIPDSPEDANAAAALYQQLEQLRLRMNRELQEENFVEATRIRNELEQLMKDRGIEFTTDGPTR
jgi:hypothetical protein